MKARLLVVLGLIVLAACLPPVPERERTDVFVHLERSAPDGSIVLTFHEDGLVRVQDERRESWREISLAELDALGADVVRSGFFGPGFAENRWDCPECPVVFLKNATTYHIRARVGAEARNATYAVALGVLFPNGTVVTEFDIDALAGLLNRLDRVLQDSKHHERPLT